MTTSKQHDHLNRLLQIAAVLYTSTAVSSAHVHNDANQRIQATLADRSGSDLCIVHLRLA